MKDLIVIIVIVALVFGGSYLAEKYYESSGKEIITMLEDLSKGLESDSFDEKQTKVEKLKDEWDKRQKVWIAFQYHETINEIENFIIECCNHYKSDERDDFDISFEKVKRSIDDLKYREEITFVNVM